jgi:hypothetical protein
VQWVKSRLQGSWNSSEEYESVKAFVDDHLNELNLYKKLKFHEA